MPHTEIIIFLFTTILIILSIIDWRTQYLPDIGTLSLLWLGLWLNTSGFFVPMNEALLGAISGYLSLWIITRLFYWKTGKIGMGDGDLKLFSALGAWFGWKLLPEIMAIAAISGLIVLFWKMKRHKHPRNEPIPFGPFLAIAGCCALYTLCS